ncbi:hypothetical protein [Achromobacter spanius]|uniref:hypothetical protein n=1 Tax=Achromobacter spanius TaxID=217203 RepID=UPI0013DF58EC|nr:hypothetical protein [Achromobacter spanius]
MAQHTVTISVRLAWWVRWYLSGVALAAQITGATPDAAKVTRWIGRGLSVRVTRRP